MATAGPTGGPPGRRSRDVHTTKQEYQNRMTPRMGATLAGVFSIIASHMYLIFEHKHLSRDNCTSLQRYNGTTFKFFLICWRNGTILFQALSTTVVSCLLLYSVYAQIYWGPVVYAFWIICYELINLVVEIFWNDSSLKIVRINRWFGWVSRSSMHCYWMFYVIPYACSIYRSQKHGNIIFQRPIDFAGERKSRILSLSLHELY